MVTFPRNSQPIYSWAKWVYFTVAILFTVVKTLAWVATDLGSGWVVFFTALFYYAFWYGGIPLVIGSLASRRVKSAFWPTVGWVSVALAVLGALGQRTS